MKVAFFDNGNLGLLFCRLAQRLQERHDMEVYIICLSYKKAQFYEKRFGVKSLYTNINDHQRHQSGEEVIRNLEYKFDAFSLNKAIMLDRVLSEWNAVKAANFLTSFTYNLKKVIEQEDIDIIFGEITWAVEYISYYLMQYLGKHYYNPLNTSVIPGRLCFLNSYNDNSFIKNIESGNEVNEVVEGFMKDRMQININNQASFLKSKLPPNFVKRSKNLLFTYNKEDYRYALQLKLKILKKYAIRSQINAIKTSLFVNFKDIKDKYPNKKLALLALHVQPEATPDTVAPEFSNQLELARNISKNLPSDYLLLIKEHPNGIGSRAVHELLQFRNIPNSILLDPFESTNTFIKNIDVVFTIAGTISFEASLYGIHSFVFSDVYYNIFPYVTKVNNVKEIKQELSNREKLPKDELYQKNLSAYVKVYNNSFEGDIYDPFLKPKVLEEKNIINLEKTFVQFIRTIMERE
ncbi:MAG: Capsule polysaccharide biosynthesis protein [Deferribacteraceae bacterium]|jgi:hypothetical protein|nr:Capsule polysaccharide biosynthesis protein [Deferribacteraceae bacterium]